ncbi:MAG: peptidoglycan -binding protein, partial [Pseudomonadota bacterium]
RAEETLALLAAAEAAKEILDTDATSALSELDRQKALLAQANALLASEEAKVSESQKQLALLNAQSIELRQQLNRLQGLLDASEARDADAQVQLELLGQNLNAALAQVAVEQKRRAELEEAERKRLAEEAKELASFRSEFFGRMRQLLEGRDQVQIVGDRFVFASEVLFATGSAQLGETGKAEIANVASILLSVAEDIPAEIDWVLQVDGHTDNIPVSSFGGFADNWELSQARALSVVRFLTDDLGLPPARLSANGFGEFQPIDTANTPEARQRNRRIELKLTEK